MDGYRYIRFYFVMRMESFVVGNLILLADGQFGYILMLWTREEIKM